MPTLVDNQQELRGSAVSLTNPFLALFPTATNFQSFCQFLAQLLPTG